MIRGLYWLLALMLACVSTAHADKVYVADETRAKQIVKSLNPSASDVQLRELLAPYASMRKQMGNPPVFNDPFMPFPFPFYYAQLIDYIPGARQDHADLADLDRIVLRFLGPDGRQEGADEILVSSAWAQVLAHEIDTFKDFEWLLSDHHIVAGVPFGSEAHRTMIYRLIDPDGYAGMPLGAATNRVDSVTHGRIIKFLLGGFPSPAPAGQVTAIHDFSDPRKLRADLATSDVLDIHQVRALLDVDGLIEAASSAEKYPAFDRRVSEMAKETLGILCTFSLANPDLADREKIAIAERASLVGQVCRERVSYYVIAANWRSNGLAVEDSLFASAESHIMPMEGNDLLHATLDVMLEEDVFRSFPELKIDDDPGQGLRVSAGAARHFESSDLIEALSDMAQSQKSFSGIEPTHAKAQALVERIAFKNPEEPIEEQELFELDQLAYQEIVFNWSTSTDQPSSLRARQHWYFDTACRNNWGHEQIATYFASLLIGQAEQAIRNINREESVAQSTADLDDATVQLATMRQRSKNAERADADQANLIDEWVRQQQRSIDQYPHFIGTERFVSTYAANMEQQLSCSLQ
ncbi:MAG: hypothetical protein AAGG55_06980 [Pseudomonadota bacterium]